MSELLKKVDKIHTTEMGVGRIQKNLEISEEPVSYCISKLKKNHQKLINREKTIMLKLMIVELQLIPAVLLL